MKIITDDTLFEVSQSHYKYRGQVPSLDLSMIHNSSVSKQVKPMAKLNIPSQTEESKSFEAGQPLYQLHNKLTIQEVEEIKKERVFEPNHF
jgi:hypothetical protein